MPAMFKTNERCFKQTFRLCGLEALNHRSELKILRDTFRSQNFGFHMIADDRRTFWDLRSYAIIWKPAFKAGFHMIANDSRQSQRELFPYNRRRSQTIAEPTVAIHFFQRALLAEKSKQTTWRTSR